MFFFGGQSPLPLHLHPPRKAPFPVSQPLLRGRRLVERGRAKKKKWSLSPPLSRLSPRSQRPVPLVRPAIPLSLLEAGDPCSRAHSGGPARKIDLPLSLSSPPPSLPLSLSPSLSTLSLTLAPATYAPPPPPPTLVYVCLSPLSFLSLKPAQQAE